MTELAERRPKAPRPSDNESPEVRIYTEDSRTDLPFVAMAEGSQLQLVWKADSFIDLAKVTLNAAAERQGVYIAGIQQGAVIRFEGQASLVRVNFVQPGERIGISLFFGSGGASNG